VVLEITEGIGVHICEKGQTRHGTGGVDGEVSGVSEEREEICTHIWCNVGLTC